MSHCPHYRLIAQQSRDIEDLLDLIKELEERIIKLERGRERFVQREPQFEDAWYWEHG